MFQKYISHRIIRNNNKETNSNKPQNRQCFNLCSLFILRHLQIYHHHHLVFFIFQHLHIRCLQLIHLFRVVCKVYFSYWFNNLFNSIICKVQMDPRLKLFLQLLWYLLWHSINQDLVDLGQLFDTPQSTTHRQLLLFLQMLSLQQKIKNKMHRCQMAHVFINWVSVKKIFICQWYSSSCKIQCHGHNLLFCLSKVRQLLEHQSLRNSSYSTQCSQSDCWERCRNKLKRIRYGIFHSCNSNC